MARILGGHFPQRRKVDAEHLAYVALDAFDFAVHRAGRHVDEPGGQIDEQFLEPCVFLGVATTAVG